MGLAGTLIVVLLLTSPMRVVFIAALLPIVGGVLAVTLWLARFDGAWPAHISWPILALLVFTTVLGDAAKQHGADLTVVYVIYIWGYAGLLIAAGRSGRAAAVGPPLLVALIYSSFSLCSLVIYPAPPAGVEMWHGAKGVYLGLAGSAFAAAFFMRTRKVQSPPLGEPARLLFVFTVGLCLLYLLWALVYELMRATGEQALVVACLLLIVTVIWDILMSGRSITNADGPLFPRRARIYMFYGFVLLTLATALYWGALIAPVEHRGLVASLGDVEFYVQLGIAAYGSAVVCALFVLRLGGWFARTLGATPVLPDTASQT
jgi:hypothetical protein